MLRSHDSIKTNDLIDSVIFESNDFDQNLETMMLEERKNCQLNRKLTKIEMEIYLAIRYGDPHKLRDLGAGEQVNINFEIEVEKDVIYYPIMLAAALGEAQCLSILLQNTQVEINVVDKKAETNAFWIACYFGRGKCAGMLANAGINILNAHKDTKTDALHTAIERKFYDVALMLINSKFPLNNVKEGGLTPLIIAARDPKAQTVCEILIKKGAHVNHITDIGQSALTQTVLNDN